MAEPEDFGARDRPHIPDRCFSRSGGLHFPSSPSGAQATPGDYAAHAVALLDQLAVALGDAAARREPTRGCVWKA